MTTQQIKAVIGEYIRPEVRVSDVSNRNAIDACEGSSATWTEC